MRRLLLAAAVVAGSCAPAMAEPGLVVILGFACEEEVQAVEMAKALALEPKDRPMVEGCKWLPQMMPHNIGVVLRETQFFAHEGKTIKIGEVKFGSDDSIGWSAALRPEEGMV